MNLKEIIALAEEHNNVYIYQKDFYKYLARDHSTTYTQVIEVTVIEENNKIIKIIVPCLDDEDGPLYTTQMEPVEFYKLYSDKRLG